MIRLEKQEGELPVVLGEWPGDRPRGWVGRVNEPLGEKAVAPLRMSVNRGRPSGEAEWVAKTAKRLGLGNTLRGVGRPKKVVDKGTDAEAAVR